MGSSGPKQYLNIMGKTVFEWTMHQLLQLTECAGWVVAVAADDRKAATLLTADAPCLWVHGGDSRAESVLAALEMLWERETPADDWVLVHDIARPCVCVSDIRHLLAVCRADPLQQGGLLAAPVVDTLKKADSQGRVGHTADRAGLWSALTPQLFPLAVLRQALHAAKQQGLEVRDEASAMEALGYRPLLVAGRRDNIKITYPEDLQMAEDIIRRNYVDADSGRSESGGCA